MLESFDRVRHACPFRKARVNHVLEFSFLQLKLCDLFLPCVDLLGDVEFTFFLRFILFTGHSQRS